MQDWHNQLDRKVLPVVIVDGDISNWILFFSATPQVSVLSGPILFSIYVKVLKFADDTSVSKG